MEIYEEVIDPQSVLLRLVTTADVMVDTCVEINQCVGCSAMTWPRWLCRAVRNRHRHAIEQASRRWRGGRRDNSARSRREILISTQVDTWAFQFSELEKADQERVALERQIGGLPDAAMLRDAELAEGGETRTSWYTEDEPMPLYAFDQRACDRLATLRALEALTEEVRQLTPQNAFQCGYLRSEAKADADDDDVDERVVERRRKRREEREAKYVRGEETEKALYAKEAALAFLEESRSGVECFDRPRTSQ